ncbi:hypothetical protein MASR2M29_17910 [Spirochaetota bacterium]
MFQKQVMMRRVLYALVPIVLLALWQYGLRFLLILLTSLVVGVLTEYLFKKKKGGKVSEAVLVSSVLFALSMPPAAPLWIVAIGIAFGVFMAKEVYGGFGRNIFNPAIAGRLFVYISFAGVLGASFFIPGGFGRNAGSAFGALDGMSTATPLALMRGGHRLPLLDYISGMRPGSSGESGIVLILAAAVYLVATKTAQWRLIVSTVLGGAVLSLVFWFSGIKQALPPEAMLAGSFLFVAVFMSTDPVTAPKKPASQWAYGILIGITIVIIRSFSLFPEGTSFAILLGNSFASLFDRTVASRQAAKKGAADSAKEAQK